MAKLGTFCSECCFYNNEEKSCTHGLLVTFEKRGADIQWSEDGPAIDRVCLYRRTHDWNQDLSIDERVDRCKNEVSLSGNIVLIVDNSQGLRDIILKLKEHVNENFKFIICYKEKLKTVLEQTQDLEIKTFVKSVEEDANHAKRVFDCLKFLKNGYLFIFDTSREIDYSVFYKTHWFVNVMMYRMMNISTYDGSLHNSVSSVTIYKYLNGDMEVPFADKLRDIASQEGSDSQVFSWETVNEEYSNSIQSI